MKLILFIGISILTFLILSCDNYEVSDNQADSFLKFYSIGMKDNGIRVITTDEGYLIMGTAEIAGSGKDIFILQTDKFGNSTKPLITYGGLFNENGYAIKANDEGYIIAGSTQLAELSDLDIYILQIDPNGEFLWDTVYGQSRDDEAFDVLVKDNGNMIFTGYSDTLPKKKEILFLETDRNGNKISLNYTGTPENDEGFSIVKSNRKYMIAGYKSSSNTASMLNARKIFVMRWSGEGTPDVHPFENEFPVDASSWVQSIISTNQNEYYLACNVEENQTTSAYVHVLKIDTAWNINWEKSFGERALNVANDFSIRDNYLFLCGTSTNTDDRGDLWILRASLEGDNSSNYYAGDGISYMGNGFDHTADGGFIITGANYSGDNSSMITLCKLNADGDLR